MRMAIEQYKNISEIIDNYDAFIIDLWGVIHDGIDAYPGVNVCLEQMKNKGKKVVFLSNAPRRAARAVEGLEKVGVPSSLYDHIMTSGEATHEYLKSGQHEFGKKFFMLGPQRDNGLMDGTDYKAVSSTVEADFAIVTGFEDDGCTIKDVRTTLNELLENKLTLIWANPDIAIVRQSGVRALCAGAIAEEYKKMGCKTITFGKPYQGVYEKCFDYLQGLSKKRIAMIGDNLDTDIKGANNAGIDSYLIAGGVLGKDLGVEHGQLPPLEKLNKVCKKVGTAPKAVLPAFIW